VQEIRSYEAPTRFANAPAFIKGVVNLRGVIVPIIDSYFTKPVPAHELLKALAEKLEPK